MKEPNLNNKQRVFDCRIVLGYEDRDIARALKRRARENDRSVQAEIRNIIRRAIEEGDDHA